MNRTEKRVYIDPELEKGNFLYQAFYIDSLPHHWIIASEGAINIDIDAWNTILETEALQKYPELEQLLNLTLTENIMFRKGKNSDKWYDFHL